MSDAPPRKPLPELAPLVRTKRKGRGAASNTDGRFEPYRHEAADDGWGVLDESIGRVATTVETDTARSVINHNDSPDIPFDQSINPYRGCEHVIPGAQLFIPK